MPLPALRDDALSSTPDGFALRVALPWIRSLPLSSVRDVSLAIDGTEMGVRVRLHERTIEPEALADEAGWWFLQDRIVLAGRPPLDAGAHEVTLTFRLFIPYLSGGPAQALVIPFVIRQILVLDAAPLAATVSCDVA